MRSASWLAAVLVWVAWAGAAAALGGSASDQAATLTYLGTHWGGGLEPRASLTGVDTFVSPLYADGWWYRIGGDPREHPLPAPDIEIYRDGEVLTDWVNLGGSGIYLIANTKVFDTEGPSGGQVTYVLALNRGTEPKTLTLFHYLDVDLRGTSSGDLATSFTPRFQALADGPDNRVAYKAALSTHFEVGSYPGLRDSLNDGGLTQLRDSSPSLPGDLSAAYQFGPVDMPPCASCFAELVALVSVFFNPPQDHVKGDVFGMLGQSPLLVDIPSQGVARAVWMRRTRAFDLPGGIDRIRKPAVTAQLVGVDDFDGDFRDELVCRDTLSGVAYVGDRPVSGAPTLPLNWKLSATGDFDHDGKADLLWRNTTSQKLVVWTMSGAAKTGSLVPNPDQAADANWDLAGAADFDGDGNRDLLWYNQTTGKIVMWYLDASLVRTTGLFTTPSGVGSNAWRVVAVGDYGKGAAGVYDTQDLVWQNDDSQKIVVWHMDRAATRTSGEFTTPDQIQRQPVAGPR